MPRFQSRSPSVGRSGRSLGYTKSSTLHASPSPSGKSWRVPSLMGVIVNATTKTAASSSSVNSPIKQRRRKYIERIAVAIMLLIAWSWIMVVFGMIFYHGYQYRISKHGAGTGDSSSTTSSGWSLLKDGIGSIHQRRIQADGDLLAKTTTTTDLQHTNKNSNFELRSQASPLVIFTCQRAGYLRQTLDDVLLRSDIPNDCSIGCPIYISQDGAEDDVSKVIDEYTTKFSSQHQIPVIHLKHKSALRRGSKSINSYQALAVHYGWALGQIFASESFVVERLIILEEDLHTSVDFFGYMGAMATYLDNDPTVLAVSAFNDNGFESTVDDNSRVLRSDFFPGLGWMLSKHLWDTELRSKWPTGYWDDWLREPVQRRNRHILRPEISRTYHFGAKGGASNNLFGDHLTKVELNKVAADWTTTYSDNDGGDTAAAASEQQHHWSQYLRSEASYDAHYLARIQNAAPQTSIPDALSNVPTQDVRVEYSTFMEFKRYAKSLDLMDDEKAGIPRTAYKGVVETKRKNSNGHILFLTPPMSTVLSTFRTTTTTTSEAITKR